MKAHRGYVACLRQTTSLLPHTSTSPGTRLRVHTINHALCCPSWVKSRLVDEQITGGFAFLKKTSLGMKPLFWIGLNSPASPLWIPATLDWNFGREQYECAGVEGTPFFNGAREQGCPQSRNFLSAAVSSQRPCSKEQYKRLFSSWESENLSQGLPFFPALSFAFLLHTVFTVEIQNNSEGHENSIFIVSQPWWFLTDSIFQISLSQMGSLNNFPT